MQRVIVGIDDEQSSEAAVRWVIERARDTATSIQLVTCIDVLLMMDRTPEEERLESLKKQIESAVPTVAVTTSIVEGSVAESLVLASAAADLLVVGFRRSHPVLTALAGSTAARVAAHSHCATVVVPEEWQSSRRARVVVGIGDDESDVAALDFAVREAIHPHRELVVVHAWKMPAVGWDSVAALVTVEGDLGGFHRQLTESRIAPVRRAHPNLHVREEIVEGTPATGLLSQAAGADLFVIGTHGRGPLTGLILGSTAHDLLPHSPVPVCVVPLGALVGPPGGQIQVAAESAPHA